MVGGGAGAGGEYDEYQPKTIIYHENVTTNKNYMRHVSAVKPEWIKN